MCLATWRAVRLVSDSDRNGLEYRVAFIAMSGFFFFFLADRFDGARTINPRFRRARIFPRFEPNTGAVFSALDLRVDCGLKTKKIIYVAEVEKGARCCCVTILKITVSFLLLCTCNVPCLNEKLDRMFQCNSIIAVGAATVHFLMRERIVDFKCILGRIV